MTNNCVISIPNFGKARVRATRVVHGMSVVAYAGEDESRAGKAFYPSKRTSGSFELTLKFARDKGYREVMEWLQRYQRWAGNPKTQASACRVVIPSRNFDKIGILETGVTFGDEVQSVTHTVTLGFVGSSDPRNFDNKGLVSVFKKPKDNDPALDYFYPVKQLKGNQTGWDTVYDVPAEEILLDNPGSDQPNLNPSRPGIFE